MDKELRFTAMTIPQKRDSAQTLCFQLKSESCEILYKNTLSDSVLMNQDQSDFPHFLSYTQRGVTSAFSM